MQDRMIKREDDPLQIKRKYGIIIHPAMENQLGQLAGIQLLF
jgi:hypothetical protein